MPDLLPSRYNIVTEAGDRTVILFNTASGRTLYFPKREFKAYVAPLLNGGRPRSRTNTGHAEVLRRSGFLLRADCREQEEIRRNYIRSQYQGDRVSLTIIPSQECNFACSYCFEEDRSGRMSRETAKSVVRFCKEWIYPRTHVSICWYGGEPLLALDTITWLSERMKSLVSEKNCTVNASIITNGYLLDHAAVQALLAAEVSVAQITLDGDEASHDRCRPLVAGGPTYNHVLQNVIAAARAGLYINLRVNAGRHNSDNPFTVLHQLAETGLQERISVSFGHLDDLCGNSQTARDLALPPSEFAALEYRLLLHLITLGFPVKWRDLIPRPTFCSAVRPSFLLITHDGRLGKCWNRAGNDMEAVGHVDNPFHVSDRNDPHVLLEPYNFEGCGDCAYFPLCVGGCPDRAIHMPQHRSCAPIRFSLEKQLQLRYLCERAGVP